LFKDNLLFQEQHEDIASDISTAYIPGINIGNGLTISIFGSSGTGKSEVAWWLSRKLYCKNFSCHTVALDRFYKIPVEEREDHRKRTKIIGPKELDFERIDYEIAEFKKRNRIDVLIIEGLYAGYVDGTNMRVFLEGSVNSTYSFRKMRGKENPDSDWRKFVLEREHAAVLRSVREDDEIYNANVDSLV